MSGVSLIMQRLNLKTLITNCALRKRKKLLEILGVLPRTLHNTGLEVTPLYKNYEL